MYHIDSLQCLEIMVDLHLLQKLIINIANYPVSHSVSLASVANSWQNRVQIKECLSCELCKFAMHLSFSAKYICAISFPIGEKTIYSKTEGFHKTTLFDNFSFQQLSLFKPIDNMFTEYFDSYVSETNAEKNYLTNISQECRQIFLKNIDKCFLTCLVALTLFAPHLGITIC